MKKALAILVALMLLAMAPLSLAESVKLTENASGFDLTIDLPDDANVSVQTEDDVPYTFVTFTDETKPLVYISVAPSEEYDGDTISDLSKEDLDSLFTVISADMENPSYTMKKTANEYDYMLLEDDSENDSALMVLIYEGYFVQMSVWNSSYDVLTKDDMAVAESLLDTLKIVEVK